MHCHCWIKAADEIHDFKNILEEDLYASIADYSEEKWDEEHINSIKIFFIKLRTSKIAASTHEIRKYCVRHNIPAPSLIIYDGEEYTLKWILEKSLTKKSVEIWKFIQRKLAKKFLTLFEDDTKKFKYNDALSVEECRYVNYHCNATAILRIPGFLNYDTKQEVIIVDDTERTYSVREMLLSLHLTKKEIQEYRELKEQCGVYSPKKRNKKSPEPPAEPLTAEEITRAYASDLKRYHYGRSAYVFVQKKNMERQDKKDRVKYYEHCQSCYINSYSNRRVLLVTDRDFWISACEYKYKVKEPQEMHIECIQLSFLVTDPRKSEFDFVPTLEQEIEFLLECCSKFNLPKPEIVSDGEKLEVKWVWTDIMTKAGLEKDFDFNFDFDAIQEKLFRLFWDLGVESRKLCPTTMLRVPGTLNTSKNTRVRVVLESDERISHKKFS